MARLRADGMPSMSRSTVLLIAAFAIGAVVAHLLFSHPSKMERPREPPRPQEVAQAMPSVDVSPSPPPRAKREVQRPREAAQLDPEETLPMATPSQASKETAAELRERARFPPTSRRIENNIDPIIQDRPVKERLNPPGQGRKPTLVVFASSFSYEAPNPIILYAKFIREYPQDWAVRTDAEVAGELRNAADEIVAQVDLRDDGVDRDIEAGDGVFTAQITPAPEESDHWNGLIRVEVYGETADGDRRSAKTHFYYGVPSAKLTGNYKDQIVDGHLQLQVEIDVKESGQYRLDATLSGAQALIAWAEDTAQLEPGVTWVPLTFWGLAFREANEPGPYRLSSITLANVSDNPPQLNDATSTNYQTAPYRPQDFSDKSFNDPQLLERAARLEAGGR